MVEMKVASTDVMISLPVPHYIARKLRLGRLYRMNYMPHITLAGGTNLPNARDLDEIVHFFKEIVEPPRITLRGLSAIPMGDANLLWANAVVPSLFEYHVGSFLPDFYKMINKEDPGEFPHAPFGFRPHVSLQFRKRPFRWLPKMNEVSWVQRWAEIVEGDRVVERIVIGKRSSSED